MGFPGSSTGKEFTCSAGDPSSWVRRIPWRRDKLPTPVFLGFSCGLAGKESACNVGDLGLIPGLARSPGERKGYPMKWLSHVQLFATAWTVAYHASPSMGYFRQEYWSGLPFPSPEDLPDPGMENTSFSISFIGRQVLYQPTQTAIKMT